MAEEYTGKFKVDISDLKKNIGEANKQIKLANATFKNETAGLGKWSESADGLSSKLKQLKTVLENQKSVLKSYQEQLQRQQTASEENGRKADELKKKLQELAEKGVKSTDEEYQKYKKSLTDVLSEQAKNEKACEDLTIAVLEQEAAVKKTESDINHYSDSLSDLQEEQRKSAEEAERQASAYEQLQQTVSEQKAELDDLKDAYTSVVLEQGENSEAAEELSKKISDLSGELSQNQSRLADAESASNRLDQSMRETTKGSELASGGFTVMKGALADLVANGIRAAISGLADLAKASYEAWEAYDEGFDTIKKYTGATGDAAEELKRVYSAVSKTTLGSFSDIGEAVGEVNTRFDILGDELQRTSEQFVKFAKINGTSVKDSVDSVQSAMAAFGLESKDAAEVLDLLTTAGQRTGASVSTVAQQVRTNGAAMREMGYSISDATLLLAQLDKSGVDASFVMNGLKRSLSNAAKAGLPLSAAMDSVEESILGASSSVEAINAASELFGTRAGPAIAAAVRDGRLSFQAYGQDLEAFRGSVSSTYESILDAPDKIALATQNLKVVGASVTSEVLARLEPTITRLVDILTDFLDKHGDEIVDLTGKLVDDILPPIVNFFEWLLEHLPEVKEDISNTWHAFADSTPLGALSKIKDGVGFVRDAWKVLTKETEDSTGIQRSLFGALVDDIRQKFTSIPSWLFDEVVAPIGEFFSSMWENLKTKADDAWTGIKSTFSAMPDWFKNKFSEAWTNVKEVFSTGGQIFEGIKEGITEAFTHVVNAIIRGLNKVIETPFNAINKTLDKIRNAEILGYRPFKNLGKIGVPHIPELERGGVLKRGQMGLLEGNGAEAVVPLDKNKAWIRAVTADLMRELGAAGLFGTPQAATVNNTKEMNFTQIINAPSQPSRIELYRQTRNLLNYANLQGGV